MKTKNHSDEFKFLKLQIKRKNERRRTLADLPLDDKIKILIELQKMAEMASIIGGKKHYQKPWILE